MTLSPGTRPGAYEIVALVGAGGMGEVYRARDTRLDRTVVIKVLPAALAGDPQLRDRVNREARAISSLSHPHICALFDVGHQEGVDFLVLEYLEGEMLAARLARGGRDAGPGLPPHDALAVASQIGDALDKAHRSGIVHRDLKPANVFLVRRTRRPAVRGDEGRTAVSRERRPGAVSGDPADRRRQLALGRPEITAAFGLRIADCGLRNADSNPQSAIRNVRALSRTSRL